MPFLIPSIANIYFFILSHVVFKTIYYYSNRMKIVQGSFATTLDILIFRFIRSYFLVFFCKRFFFPSVSISAYTTAISITPDMILPSIFSRIRYMPDNELKPGGELLFHTRKPDIAAIYLLISYAVYS